MLTQFFGYSALTCVVASVPVGFAVVCAALILGALAVFVLVISCTPPLPLWVLKNKEKV